MQLPPSLEADRRRPLSLAQAKLLNFGSISLNPTQAQALGLMNQQLIALCRTLPEPLVDSAILTLQSHYAGSRLVNLLNFYTKFYTPTWSVIYWLQERPPLLTPAELESAYIAQAMAMFLHMLDDHLVDGQLTPTHLLLQLRTKAWMRFSQHTDLLARMVPDGPAVGQALIDTYFGGVHHPPQVDSLEAYCHRFRSQLSTGLVVPMLIAARTGCPTAEVRQAFESFGMAWRLLDDLRDCQSDVYDGEPSGVYYQLTPEGRAHWEACRGKPDDAPEWQRLIDYLDATGTLTDSVQHLVRALGDAQKAAEAAGLVGYAAEFRQLAQPLLTTQSK